jgi:hypothetical protein
MKWLQTKCSTCTANGQTPRSVRPMFHYLSSDHGFAHRSYYSGPPAPKASLSSCYFWNPVGSDANMAGCILFHNGEPVALVLTLRTILDFGCMANAVAETNGITGTWDSIHVAEVKNGAKESHYKLTTTIILQCTTSAEGVANEVGGYKMQVVRKCLRFSQ